MRDLSRARDRMVEVQIAQRGVRDPCALDAMRRVPRAKPSSSLVLKKLPTRTRRSRSPSVVLLSFRDEPEEARSDRTRMNVE